MRTPKTYFATRPLFGVTYVVRGTLLGARTRDGALELTDAPGRIVRQRDGWTFHAPEDEVDGVWDIPGALRAIDELEQAVRRGVTRFQNSLAGLARLGVVPKVDLKALEQDLRTVLTGAEFHAKPEWNDKDLDECITALGGMV